MTNYFQRLFICLIPRMIITTINEVVTSEVRTINSSNPGVIEIESEETVRGKAICICSFFFPCIYSRSHFARIIAICMILWNFYRS